MTDGVGHKKPISGSAASRTSDYSGPVAIRRKDLRKSVWESAAIYWCSIIPVGYTNLA